MARLAWLGGFLVAATVLLPTAHALVLEHQTDAPPWGRLHSGVEYTTELTLRSEPTDGCAGTVRFNLDVEVPDHVNWTLDPAEGFGVFNASSGTYEFRSALLFSFHPAGPAFRTEKLTLRANATPCGPTLVEAGTWALRFTYDYEPDLRLHAEIDELTLDTGEEGIFRVRLENHGNSHTRVAPRPLSDWTLERVDVALPASVVLDSRTEPGEGTNWFGFVNVSASPKVSGGIPIVLGFDAEATTAAPNLSADFEIVTLGVINWSGIPALDAATTAAALAFVVARLGGRRSK